MSSTEWIIASQSRAPHAARVLGGLVVIRDPRAMRPAGPPRSPLSHVVRGRSATFRVTTLEVDRVTAPFLRDPRSAPRPSRVRALERRFGYIPSHRQSSVEGGSRYARTTNETAWSASARHRRRPAWRSADRARRSRRPATIVRIAAARARRRRAGGAEVLENGVERQLTGEREVAPRSWSRRAPPVVRDVLPLPLGRPNRRTIVVLRRKSGRLERGGSSAYLDGERQLSNGVDSSQTGSSL